MPARFVLALAQTGIVLVALAAAPFAPPARGRMLVVPLSGGDQAAAVRVARDADALILGAGPFPRSTVVEGSRVALLARAVPAGMLVVAAPAAGCGADVAS
jgi:hypothetical protein